MQVVLVMFKGDSDRRSFSIARDVTVVGRREDCDLRVPIEDVSRKHCRLVKEADSIRVEDLGSSNGTYVNGHRVQEQALSPGDWITIGPVQFAVQIDGVPADEEIHEPVRTEPPPETASEDSAVEIDDFTKAIEGELTEAQAGDSEFMLEELHDSESSGAAQQEWAEGSEENKE